MIPILVAWTSLAVGVALLADRNARRLGGAGMVFLGLGLAALQVSSGFGARPLWSSVPAGFLVINGTLMLAGAAAVAAAFARGWRRGRRPWVEAAVVGEGTGNRPALAVYAAGIAAAALGPHLGLVFAGAALASWSSWSLHSNGGRTGWPVAPALVTLLVLFCYWFLATIAGPEGLSVSAVPLLPLSPAADRVLALALLLLAWIMCGLWPFHLQGFGALAAPAALLLFIRVGLPAAPAGLEHWQPLAFPIAVVGLWAGALTRSLPTLARAGALLGLASLDRHGLLGAALLLLASIGLEWLASAGGRQGQRVSAVLMAGIAAVAAWGSLLVTVGGLRSEVVYTVLAAAGTAVGLSRPAPSGVATAPPGS